MLNGEKNSKLPEEKSEETQKAVFDDVQTAVNEISLMAAKGGKLTVILDLPERCLYFALRELYESYRTQRMTAEQCKDGKTEAIRQYEKDRSDAAWYLKLIQTHAKMWNRIEHAGTVYAQSDNRTPEADAFFEAVYGCRPKERGE